MQTIKTTIDGIDYEFADPATAAAFHIEIVRLRNAQRANERTASERIERVASPVKQQQPTTHRPSAVDRHRRRRKVAITPEMAQAAIERVVEAGAGGAPSEDLIRIAGIEDVRGMSSFAVKMREYIRGRANGAPVETLLWKAKERGQSARWHADGKRLREIGVVK